jgi:hypothetical protein
MAALEDEECQLKGMILLSYIVDMSEAKTKYTELLMTQGQHSMIIDLPFRMARLHFCYNDARLRPILNLVQFVMGRYIRLRFRTHFGKRQQSHTTVVDIFSFLGGKWF